MNLRDIVEDLRKQGHKVSYTARNDGSIIIHSIDGEKFRQKEGNKKARSLVGVDLSEAQKKQRQFNASRQKDKPRPKGLPSLSKKELKKLRKLNRKIKKTGSGRLGRENARRKKKEGGWKKVENAAKDIMRKNLNLANTGQITELLGRIHAYKGKASSMENAYKELSRQYSWTQYSAYEEMSARLYAMEKAIREATQGKSLNETMLFCQSSQYALIVSSTGNALLEILRDNEEEIGKGGVKQFFKKGK